MSWKMIGDPKTRKLTQTLAKEFANMTPAPHDRPLNATRAAVIRTALELKKFRTAEWATAYCKETRQTYRINGKHTSTVLASMDGEFPKDLTIIVEHYGCDKMEDVAALYATFDTRSAARTTSDINMIYSAAVPELAEIGRRVINLCVVGVAYATWEDNYSRRSSEERAALIVTNAEFCLWLDEIGKHFSNNSTNHIQRGSVVAAMYKTWQKAKGDSTTFWTAVRDESDPKPDMPSRKLAKFLTTTRIAAKSGSKMKTTGQRETYAKCITAWNAYRSGEPTNLNYHATSKTPVAK